MWARACAKLNPMEISRSDQSRPRAHLAHYATGKIGVDFPDELWFSGSRPGKKRNRINQDASRKHNRSTGRNFSNGLFDRSIETFNRTEKNMKIDYIYWQKMYSHWLGFSTREIHHVRLCVVIGLKIALISPKGADPFPAESAGKMAWIFHTLSFWAASQIRRRLNS